jgi:surface protein
MPSTIITTAKLVNSPSQFHDSANFNRGNHRGLDESERERIYKQALKTVTDQAVVASVVEQHHHVHHHFHSNDSDYDSGREHNGNYEDSNRQSLKRRRHRSRCFGLALLSSGLALVAISIGVLLHLVRSTQKNDAVDSNAPPVVPPIQMPTFPPLEQRHVAFESTEELYQAVDAYLAALVASASSMEELDNDLWTSTNTTSSDANDTSASRRPPPPRLDVPSSPVALKYGYPMGTWNVSLLSNFSRVFDAYRHNGLPFDSLRSSSSTDDDSASSDTSSSSASSVLAFVNEDLSGWDVSNAETLFAMFAGAHDFIGFGLDEWDVSRVTNFSYMFMDAHSLQANVSSWNTSAAVSMEGLFQDATSFNGDLSAWDVSRVTNLAHMLLGAVSFEGLGGLQDWNVSRVETLHSTFQYADSFLGDSIASWDVSRVTIFADMAWDAKVFDADLSRWNVGKATDMSFMLAAPSYTGRAGNGASVSLTGWDTSRVENMWGIFKKASSFVGNISTWNVSAVLDLGRALSHCYEFNGDLSRWDTSGALFMEEMFLEASSFASDVSAWDTRHVEDMSSMVRMSVSCRQYLMHSCPETSL